MMNHVMIDLETMGTRPGSAIVSIGAVGFDPQSGVVGAEFYQVVDLHSCDAAGLTFDPGTVLWWLEQGEAARAALRENPRSLPQVLLEFIAWWRAHSFRHVWSHGGNFDEPILQAAFRAVGVAAPWKYWDARCTRTIYDLAGVKPDRAAGVHHNALDDARAQTSAVIAAYAKLGLARAAEPVTP